MIDPASIAAIKAACDFLIGSIPQIFPLVHDESTRKRLFRLDGLIQKIKDETLTTEELAEAKELAAKIRVHALMTKNDKVLPYLEIAMPLLEAHKSNPAEQLVDLIMLDDEAELRALQEAFCDSTVPTPPSVECRASTPDITKFIVVGKDSLLLDTNACSVDEAARTGVILPACTPATSSPPSPSPQASPSQASAQTENAVPEAIAAEEKSKTHPRLKKAACWTLVVTVSPAFMLVPQVRRNLWRHDKK